MHTNRTKALLAILLTSIATGCAPSTAVEDGELEGAEGALSDAEPFDLPGVAAVEIATLGTPATKQTLGAPGKVRDLLSAVRRLSPADAIPRCLDQKRRRLTFLDASGATIATAATQCGAFGSLTFTDGRASFPMRLDENIDKTTKAPLAAGDVLWGITKIELAKTGEPRSRVFTGAQAQQVLHAFDLDAVPDGNAAVPKCLPSHSLKFERGGTVVAQASIPCGTGAVASFSTIDHTHAADARVAGTIPVERRWLAAASE